MLFVFDLTGRMVEKLESGVRPAGVTQLFGLPVLNAPLAAISASLMPAGSILLQVREARLTDCFRTGCRRRLLDGTHFGVGFPADPGGWDEAAQMDFFECSQGVISL